MHISCSKNNNQYFLGNLGWDLEGWYAVGPNVVMFLA